LEAILQDWASNAHATRTRCREPLLCHFALHSSTSGRIEGPDLNSSLRKQRSTAWIGTWSFCAVRLASRSHRVGRPVLTDRRPITRKPRRVWDHNAAGICALAPSDRNRRPHTHPSSLPRGPLPRRFWQFVLAARSHIRGQPAAPDDSAWN